MDEQLLAIAVFEHNAHQVLPVRGSVQEDEHGTGIEERITVSA